MPTYLLVWNAENWGWETLDKDHEQYLQEGYFKIDWCCGNHKPMQIDSRVFLIRQGKDPRGIFASGLILSDPYPAPCWNPMSECHEGTVPTIDVKIDSFVNPNKEGILSREKLFGIHNSMQYWDIPISGIHIDPAVAGELEVLWKKFLGERV